MYMSKRKIFPSTHSVFVLGKGKRKSHQFYCMVKLYDTLYAKLPMHVDSMIWCEQILCTTLFCFLLLYPYSKRVYIKLPLYLFYTSNIKSLILMWGSIPYTILFDNFMYKVFFLFFLCCDVLCALSFAAAVYKRQPPPPPTFPLLFYTSCDSCMGGDVRKQKSVRDWST
jgi:hypothetical protein